MTPNDIKDAAYDADREETNRRIANTFATLEECKTNKTGANISPEGVRGILLYVDWLQMDLATQKAKVDELNAQSA